MRTLRAWRDLPLPPPRLQRIPFRPSLLRLFHTLLRICAFPAAPHSRRSLPFEAGTPRRQLVEPACRAQQPTSSIRSAPETRRAATMLRRAELLCWALSALALSAAFTQAAAQYDYQWRQGRASYYGTDG